MAGKALARGNSFFNLRILVSIALFASLSRRGLGTRNDGSASYRSEKGYGDENVIDVALSASDVTKKTV